ncbi:hypothetical protein CASFOL_030434 [Castilleja foliolosa]|uniref:Uncharacterized protein n=1 Tax=Castilleja foliolosa TaxID=1961234 RepID=A0ABD3C7X5_9LAMI
MDSSFIDSVPMSDYVSTEQASIVSSNTGDHGRKRYISRQEVVPFDISPLNDITNVIGNARQPRQRHATQVQSQNLTNVTINNSFINLTEDGLVENTLTYVSDVPVGTFGLSKKPKWSINSPHLIVPGCVTSINIRDDLSKRLNPIKNRVSFQNSPLSDITNVIDNHRQLGQHRSFKSANRGNHMPKRPNYSNYFAPLRTSPLEHITDDNARQPGQILGTQMRNQNLTEITTNNSFIDLTYDNLFETTLTYGSDVPVEVVTNSSILETLHDVVISSENATAVEKRKRTYVRRNTSSIGSETDCLASSNSRQIENSGNIDEVTKKQLLPRKNISRRSRRSVPELREDANATDHPALPSEYGDIGDASYECQFCHAEFWLDERTLKKGTSTNPTYSRCCQGGIVDLPRLVEPPTFLSELLHGNSSRSKHFQENIRSYNSMFCFTSMGGKIDHDINKGSGPRIFRLNGQNYHMIGSLIPEDSSTPKFAQMYIYDTENEVSNRKNYGIIQC